MTGSILNDIFFPSWGCSLYYLCMYARSLQLCLILCDPMDCNPPGSSVHGILQARILEWVAIPFSRGSSQLGLNPHLLHWQAESCPLSHLGSPKVKLLGTQLYLTLCNPMDSSLWNSPGQNTGVDSHPLLQGIFPTQGWNLHLLRCRRMFYHWATGKGPD